MKEKPQICVIIAERQREERVTSSFGTHLDNGVSKCHMVVTKPIIISLPLNLVLNHIQAWGFQLMLIGPNGLKSIVKYECLFTCSQ